MGLNRGFCWVGSLAGAIVLTLMSAATAAAATRGVGEHTTRQSSAEVRDYWTPERMREAEPIALPPTPAAGGSGARKPAFYAQPPDHEIDPSQDTVFPYRIHGVLFFTQAGQNGACSATVVTARSRDLVMTAAHCLARGAEVTGSGVIWSADVLFVPGYRDGAAPFGGFAATRLGAPIGWLQAEDPFFDVGVANLAPGAGGLIQDQLGARGLAFNRSSKSYRNDLFELYGYPGKPEPTYDGQRLILCLSTFQRFEGFTSSPLAAPCNQQEGSSGGGWVRNGQVQSVTSRAGCQSPIGCQLIAGTYLGEAAFQLYKRASGGISKGKSKRLKRCKRVDRRAKRLRCRGRVQRFDADPR